MRDHRKLRTFELADRLALQVYKATAAFPKSELFGLTSQLRRAAISASANIVEGAARPTKAEYLRFLAIAFASARELEYILSLTNRLGYVRGSDALYLIEKASELCKALHGQIVALDRSKCAGR